jgi:hypothetical protein
MAFAIYARNPFPDSLWQEKIHDYQKPVVTPGRPATLALFAQSAHAVAFSMEAADTKSNIVIIWGDDTGQFNVNA